MTHDYVRDIVSGFPRAGPDNGVSDSLLLISRFRNLHKLFAEFSQARGNAWVWRFSRRRHELFQHRICRRRGSVHCLRGHRDIIALLRSERSEVGAGANNRVRLAVQPPRAVEDARSFHLEDVGLVVR